jgi:hypothetical protein
MRHQTFRQYRFVVALALIVSFGWVGTATAAGSQSSSANYSINQVQIGGNGSADHDCSTNYCAQESVGDTVDGRGSSADYSAQFGADTADTPLLEEIVEGGTQNLGTLSPTSTGTATDIIKIRSYLSGGYKLYITGSPPSQGEHTLKTMSAGCPCTSQPGAEQFGINLAPNSAPDIGAGPVQVPSSTFSFGRVESNYYQSNLFMYNDGDAVAYSDTSTGETDYTLSMILNISNVTPGGQYTNALSAVVVPVF